MAKARSAPKPAAVVLRGGMHVLTESVILGAADSSLTLINFDGEQAWLTGALPLATHWQKDVAGWAVWSEGGSRVLPARK